MISKNTIIAIFILSLFILSYYKMLELKYIIIMSIFAIIITTNCITNNTIEGFNNDEALQNIASIYNDTDMTVNNLKVTGTLTVDGETKMGNKLNVSGETKLDNNLSVGDCIQINPNTVDKNKMVIYPNASTAQDTYYFFNKDGEFGLHHAISPDLPNIPEYPIKMSNLGLRIGNNVDINATKIGDRMKIYKNNDLNAPYYYFNNIGNFGIWNGDSTVANHIPNPITIDSSGFITTMTGIRNKDWLIRQGTKTGKLVFYKDNKDTTLSNIKPIAFDNGGNIYKREIMNYKGDHCKQIGNNSCDAARDGLFSHITKTT